MSNNTRASRKKDALQWAENVLAMPADQQDSYMLAAAEHILNTIDPATMADMEWNVETYYLAGAFYTNASTGTIDEAIMLDKDPSDSIFAIIPETQKLVVARSTKFVPNGKRYEFREVSGPSHPKALRTVEDYEAAPVGTVVTSYENPPLVKREQGKWTSSYGYKYTDEDLAGVRSTVVRWGVEQENAWQN